MTLKGPAKWRIRHRILDLGSRPLVMGIVNVTPDSFSDGGRYLRPEDAVKHGLRLVDEGADILDVGGESTRPGSMPVAPDEESSRIVAVVRRLAETTDRPISIDTRRASVARAALEAGAQIVNDVSAMSDNGMARLVADSGAGVVLMHMQGEPPTMQRDPHYSNVMSQVRSFLKDRAEEAQAAGVRKDAIVVDPGLGFGKRTGAGIEDNLTLIARLESIRTLGYPVLVGASRKRFLSQGRDEAPDARFEASLAIAAIAVYEGANVVRVHDVAATRRAVDVAWAARLERGARKPF